jgi:hypothetical protein
VGRGEMSGWVYKDGVTRNITPIIKTFEIKLGIDIACYENIKR